MKVVSIVGARPQFIKAAPVSRILRQQASEILVHTGQHYDSNMSDVFFEELEIPAPDYHLGVGSGSHGAQTGAMLEAIENVLLDENPDWVLVYGDTNSTLAGALAASKLHILVAHVEAGLRSFNRLMPEEVNRVLTDHLSGLLFCPSETAKRNLAMEGIQQGVHIVGDVMADALFWAAQQYSNRPPILEQLDLEPKEYFLATVHRAENTDQPERLSSILKALVDINSPVIFPVHPRTRKRIADLGYLSLLDECMVYLIEPQGYLDMVSLEKSARLILTDSGGIQKEAYWFKVPCITLRDETEWIETVENGWNYLVGVDREKIVSKVGSFDIPASHPVLYGDGRTATRVVDYLLACKNP